MRLQRRLFCLVLGVFAAEIINLILAFDTFKLVVTLVCAPMVLISWGLYSFMKRRSRVMPSEQRNYSRWIEGRFFDGQLELLLSRIQDPGPGYAVSLHDQRIWRNGEYVGDATKLSYDRDAPGWWVSYISWHGSPLDMASVADHQERRS